MNSYNKVLSKFCVCVYLIPMRFFYCCTPASDFRSGRSNVLQCLLRIVGDSSPPPLFAKSGVYFCDLGADKECYFGV